MGKHDSAQILFEELLPLAKRNNFKREIKTIFNALGVTHMQTAKHDEALKYLFASLDLSEADNDTLQQCVVLNNIGLVYMNLLDYQKALYYFNRIIAIEEPDGQIDELAPVFLNKAICLVDLRRFPEATQLINSVLSECRNKCSNEVYILAYQNLASISAYKRDFRRAEDQYLKSYLLSHVAPKDHHLNNVAGLIEVYAALNELPKAEFYLSEAEKIVETGSFYRRELSGIYSQLIAAYQKLNNIEKTSYYQSKYIALRDQIFNEQLATNLMKIEAEHLEKENKSKIEAQNKILALNKEVMLRQKYLNVFVGIVAALVFALAFMLYRSNRQKQRINFLLDTKVMERTQQLETNRKLLQSGCDGRDGIMRNSGRNQRETCNHQRFMLCG